MADTQGPYDKLTDAEVVHAGKNALAATDVEMSRRLKNSVEALDKNVCVLLTAINDGQTITERLNRRIFWLTIVIAILTAVQVFYIFYPK